MVLVYHAYLGAAQTGALVVAPGSFADHVFGSLRIGLEMFFMISGYLITETLIRKASVPGFLIDRLLRVYPAYIGVLIPLCVFGIWRHVEMFAETPAWSWPLHILANLLFLPGVFQLPIVLNVSWSLSFEMAFYLAAAWAFVLYHRGRPAAAAAFALAVGFLLFSRSATAMFFFAGIGICLWREQLISPWMRRVPPALSFVALVVVWQTLVLDYSRAQAHLNAWYAALLVLSFFLGLILFDAVVAGRGLLIAALRWRPIQFTATVSYSFYLWHAVLMWPLKRSLVPKLLPVLGPELTFVVFTLASLLLSWAVAWVSYELLESRLRQYLARRWSPRKPADAPVVVS
ncbi:Peptidoglycan/LPS O-acetylase OafA/YrhL, contains acyltransferase and SGNH-hydrolase domains [Solimonas aquatica]|uniref:Peptidoglycan/LPS O-acetylase OafA/YrhL, contains acyltransferase and SGNH-hydrolase domains n=2 Tax=Solimonas aquatica TaxID=489703 RepID=A0A1H9J8E5_9GAMM|nr:Peptidoglycan/LPS O-acetylase OafA/YrhL, contains acyltransferase and SGNH-hydrolase domains [Solimonas aquatica]